MSDRLGFVGLGIMGQPMAGHLADQWPLLVYNRTNSRTEPLVTRGARVGHSPQEVARASTVVFLMLSNDEAVRAIAEGATGLISGLSPGSLVVDHSTISPTLTRRLSLLVAERGARWCDAPVTGGDVGAEQGTLTIMVGGSEPDYHRIEPYLGVMGKRIVHVGEVGQGQTIKLVANMVSAMTLMAASEGIRMGLEAHLKLEDLATVMTYGSAQSFELSKVLDRWSHQNFSPGFSVENRYKDLRLAVELAEQVKFSSDLARSAEILYRQHVESGFGAEDETSYIKRW